jgi:hypothetical protein
LFGLIIAHLARHISRRAITLPTCSTLPLVLKSLSNLWSKSFELVQGFNALLNDGIICKILRSLFRLYIMYVVSVVAFIVKGHIILWGMQLSLPLNLCLTLCLSSAWLFKGCLTFLCNRHGYLDVLPHSWHTVALRLISLTIEVFLGTNAWLAMSSSLVIFCLGSGLASHNDSAQQA